MRPAANLAEQLKHRLGTHMARMSKLYPGCTLDACVACTLTLHFLNFDICTSNALVVLVCLCCCCHQVIKTALTSTGIMGLLKAGWTTIKVCGVHGCGSACRRFTVHGKNTFLSCDASTMQSTVHLRNQFELDSCAACKLGIIGSLLRLAYPVSCYPAGCAAHVLTTIMLLVASCQGCFVYVGSQYNEGHMCKTRQVGYARQEPLGVAHNAVHPTYSMLAWPVSTSSPRHAIVLRRERW